MKTARWQSPTTVLIAGCLIAAVGFGARSSLGLFLEPMTQAHGWTRETFGMALALQNLFWGLGLPVAGMLADRWGAMRVIVLGAIAYATGLYLMGSAQTPTLLYLSAGVLRGLGIAFSAFSLASVAMVRVVGPERRSVVLGLGTAAGSFGQVVFSPLAQGFIGSLGWAPALSTLALIVLSMVPLACLLPGRATASKDEPAIEQGLADALFEAFAHRGFVLLTTGFFVCGFHVAFITVHFPAYIADLGLNPAIGALSRAVMKNHLHALRNQTRFSVGLRKSAL